MENEKLYISPSLEINLLRLDDIVTVSSLDKDNDTIDDGSIKF